jgi:CRP/FNR family transcriptional regulator, cyclic AMP receptor protein
MENLAESLKLVPLLAALKEEHLAMLAKLATTKTFNQGKVIIKQGEPGAGLFVIMDGTVEVTMQPQPGEPEIKVNTLSKGDFFGEMALIDGYPRNATITALSNTKVVELGRWVFLDAMRREPTIGAVLVPILTRRIRSLEEHKHKLAAAESGSKS